MKAILKSKHGGPVLKAFRAAGVDEDLAYTATKRIEDMAASNLTNFVQAKFEVLQAKFEVLQTKFESEFNSQRWMIRLVIAMLGAVIALIVFLFQEVSELRRASTPQEAVSVVAPAEAAMPAPVPPGPEKPAESP